MTDGDSYATPFRQSGRRIWMAHAVLTSDDVGPSIPASPATGSGATTLGRDKVCDVSPDGTKAHLFVTPTLPLPREGDSYRYFRQAVAGCGRNSRLRSAFRAPGGCAQPPTPASKRNSRLRSAFRVPGGCAQPPTPASNAASRGRTKGLMQPAGKGPVPTKPGIRKESPTPPRERQRLCAQRLRL